MPLRCMGCVKGLCHAESGEYQPRRSTPIAEVPQGMTPWRSRAANLYDIGEGRGGKAGPSSGLSPCAGAQLPLPRSNWRVLRLLRYL